MSTKIKCHWFAPSRTFRSFAIEARHRPLGWMHIVRSSGSTSVTNFGDELAAFVLEDATGRSVEWAPFGREDVNVIGSNVVHYAREGGVGQIWGLGVHEPVLTSEQKARIAPKVLAIRGPNSRAHLGLADDTPLGDPGLLARHLGPQKPRKSGRKLLIAHFSAFASPTSRSKMTQLVKEGFEVAPPNLHPLEMTFRIASADFVACSGLHGTIISHSVGTPVELITFSDDPATVPAYKYHDYFASLGSTPPLERWSSLLESRTDQVRRIERAEASGAEITEKITPMIDALYAAAQPLR